MHTTNTEPLFLFQLAKKRTRFRLGILSYTCAKNEVFKMNTSF